MADHCGVRLDGEIPEARVESCSARIGPRLSIDQRGVRDATFADGSSGDAPSAAEAVRIAQVR
jgi:hypothetical protein